MALNDVSPFAPVDLLGGMVTNAIATNMAVKNYNFRTGIEITTQDANGAEVKEVPAYLDYRFIGGMAAALAGQFTGNPMVRRVGHDVANGLLNSFDHVHCQESNVLPSGEVVTLGSVLTYQGAILSGSLAPYTGRSHVLRYIGSNLTFVRPAGAAPLAMMVGDDTGEIVFDGCTVQCDMTPMLANDPIGAKTPLTHAKLAQFIVRRSSLPLFRVSALAGTTRLPMGIRVQTTAPVNSSAGTAALAGWVVDNSKELNIDWEFTASFTGSFAANANNKRLVLQAGPVGALVDVLDMTSLAANGGNWEIQLTASRLGNIDGSFTAHKWKVSATLISSNATVGTKVGVASGTVAVATNMQFSLQATGVAAADIVLGLINVDGQN